MYCIPPLDIGFSQLTTSIAEPDTSQGEVAWVSGSAIAIDTVRIRTSTHRKYRAIAAIAAGSNTVAPESAPTLWQDIGPTNKYAMIDLNRNIGTKSVTTLTATITPNKRINTVFLSGVVGSTALLEVLDGSDNVIKSKNYALSNRFGIRTYTEYFFGEFSNVPTILEMDLPQITSIKVRITINSSGVGGAVQIGVFAVGNSKYIGEIQWQPEDDAQNFSKIERAFDGSLELTNLIRRRSVPQLSLRLHSPKAITNLLRQLRRDLNAKPAIWSGLDDKTDDDYFESVLIFGIYRQFKLNLKYIDFTETTMLLEEM